MRGPGSGLLLRVLSLIVAIGVGALLSWRTTPVTSDVLIHPQVLDHEAPPDDLVTRHDFTVKRSSGDATLDGFKNRASALRLDPLSDIQDWRTLFRDWIERDPVDAFSYLESWKGDGRLDIWLPIAMRLWLSRDPTAASQYAASRVRLEPASYEWYLSPLLEHISRGEGIRGVTSFAGTLPQDYPVYNHVVPVLAKYMLDHVTTSRQVIDSLAHEPSKPGLYEMLGSMYALKMGWPGLDRLISDVSGAPYARNAYLGAMITLHRTEPAKVRAWLDSQPISEDLDLIRLRIANGSFVNDPEAAVRVAASISAPAVRAEAIGPALRGWLTADFNRAQAWAIESDIDPNVVAAAIVATEAPPSGFFEQKIKSITAAEPRVRERQQVHYFLSWRRVAPDAADRWLESSALPAEVKQMLRQMNGTQDASR